MALAATLAARGHTVTFFHLGEIIAAPDCVDTARLPSPESARWTDACAVVPGVRDLLAHTGQLAAALPDALRAAQIDAVVGDQLDPGVGLAAAFVGIPWVSVACALLVNREAGIPPPFTAWHYNGSRIGVYRNRVGWWVHDLLMAPLSRAIARWAGTRGLPQRNLDDCLSPYAQISQTVAGLDFPRRERPAMLHYVGPIRPTDEARMSLPRDDRPLVFASLGTLQGHRVAIFRHIAHATHAIGLRLVLAHGGRLSASDVADLPGQPIVRNFVPQRRVLEQASVLIGHGGMNTVMDALAVGVPIVAIPLAYEQAAIGTRLARCGAGIAVPRLRLTSERLQAALREILQDPSYAAAARHLRTEIMQAGGVDRAADIVGYVARTGRPYDGLAEPADTIAGRAFA